MNDQVKTFGEVATALARNPLGIIALFIVLVYGFASLVTAFTGGLSAAERMPLIYFLMGFPILVLAAFTWLVSKHSGKLFAPGDFKNEDNYVKMQLSTVASLAVTPGPDAALYMLKALREIADYEGEDTAMEMRRIASDAINYITGHAPAFPREPRDVVSGASSIETASGRA